MVEELVPPQCSVAIDSLDGPCRLPDGQQDYGYIKSNVHKAGGQDSLLEPNNPQVQFK